MEYVIFIIGLIVGYIMINRNFFLIVMYYHYFSCRTEESFLMLYDKFSIKPTYEELKSIESLPDDHTEFLQFMKLKRDKVWGIFTKFYDNVKRVLFLDYGLITLGVLAIFLFTDGIINFMIGFFVAHIIYWLLERVKEESGGGCFILAILEIVLRGAAEDQN